MRIVDADSLLKKWDDLSPRGRTEFDQVIMNEPTVKAIVITDVHKHESRIDMDEFTNMINSPIPGVNLVPKNKEE